MTLRKAAAEVITNTSITTMTLRKAAAAVTMITIITIMKRAAPADAVVIMIPTITMPMRSSPLGVWKQLINSPLAPSVQP